jgi:hypothetical protein
VFPVRFELNSYMMLERNESKIYLCNFSIEESHGDFAWK